MTLKFSLNVNGSKRTRSFKLGMGIEEVPNSHYIGDVSLNDVIIILRNLERVKSGEIKIYNWGGGEHGYFSVESGMSTSVVKNWTNKDYIGEYSTIAFFTALTAYKDFLLEWQADKVRAEIMSAYKKIKVDFSAFAMGDSDIDYCTVATDRQTIISLIIPDEEKHLSALQYVNLIRSRCFEEHDYRYI